MIYEFDCTLRQAENYFFKFGHDAMVLEPENLADKFLRKYRNAVKRYETIANPIIEKD